MPAIRPAAVGELDAVARYVARAFGRDAARYRRYFDYAWGERTDLGAVIEDGGEIRGFIGAIYSRRGDARYCNLTSIAVDEPYRKLTMQLFAALLRDKTLTFTCFSASEQVAKILEFFKFQTRPSEKLIVAPVSGLAGLRHGLGVRAVTGEAIAGELPPELQRIARDHAPYRCGQLVLAHRDRRCFVVTARRGRGVKAFADVLYASDPEMLVEYLPWIHLPLWRAHRTLLTGIDRAWIARPPAPAVPYAKLRPIHLRSPAASLATLDALYSELAIGAT